MNYLIGHPALSVGYFSRLPLIRVLPFVRSAESGRGGRIERKLRKDYMKKLTRLTRKEIEDKWIEKSEHVAFDIGASLCCFLKELCTPLYLAFNWHVWGDVSSGTRPKSINLGSAVWICETAELNNEEAYLLRALTLNILLDDNEHLLEEA